MEYYLKIYKTLFSLNLSRFLTYRSNLISEVIGSIIWGLFSIMSILLLTSKTSSVYGWSREELLLLTASFGIIWGIFHMLFMRNFQNISHLIDYGTLDGKLLQPVDTQFIISTQIINYPSLIRIIINTGLLIYFMSLLHISFSLLHTLGYVLLIIFGVLLLYAIFFISMTVLIWNPRLSNIIEVLYTVAGISRYPREMFSKLPSFLFVLLLPLTFAVISPTRVLIQKVFLGDIVGLVVSTVILLVITRLFWKFALRSYTSASN